MQFKLLVAAAAILASVGAAQANDVIADGRATSRAAAQPTISSGATDVMAVSGMRLANVLYGDPNFNDDQRSSRIDLGTILTTGPGVVEIYDYRLGEPGRLLASKELQSGANPWVRVNVGVEPRHDVVAVLSVNGQVVDQRIIPFSHAD